MQVSVLLIVPGLGYWFLTLILAPVPESRTKPKFKPCASLCQAFARLAFEILPLRWALTPKPGRRAIPTRELQKLRDPDMHTICKLK